MVAIAARIAFVLLSCNSQCKFTLREPDAVIGTVRVVVAPLSVPWDDTSGVKFTGELSLSGPAATSFRLSGDGCTRGGGVCTLVTVGAPNGSMPHPVEYHVIVTATHPSLQGSPFRYEYKITGFPKGGWVGPS